MHGHRHSSRDQLLLLASELDDEQLRHVEQLELLRRYVPRAMKALLERRR
ncbi:hypothetical protein [Paraburkholderia sediminicola]